MSSDAVTDAAAAAITASHTCVAVAVALAKFLINQTVSDGVAHSKDPRKFAYHVTFDLDLNLEHIMDAS